MIDKLKDLETLIEGDFKDLAGVYREYKISAEDVLKVERILFAIYECGWDAQAIVIFLGKDNNLYEIHSYHCSCYDLEGQWEPELIDEEFIKHAIENYNKSSYYNEGSYLEHLKKILDKIQTKDEDKSMSESERLRTEKARLLKIKDTAEQKNYITQNEHVYNIHMWGAELTNKKYLKLLDEKFDYIIEKEQEKEAWAYELKLLDEKENPLIYLLEIIKDLEKRIEDLEN